MKLLVIDIETAPSTTYTWGLFKQNIGLNQIVTPGYTLCFAAKWVGEAPEFWSQYDKDMVLRAWELLDEADAVIHYNGTRFDIPTLQREFVKGGMPPPSPFKQIDLLRVVRGQFRFLSNKMDHVSQELGLGAKVKTPGMELWVACMEGDKEAWELMEEYNLEDVDIAERMYLRLLPWIRNHPNWGLYVDEDRPVCTNCASEHVIKKGTEKTKTRTYQRYRCRECHTSLRGTRCIKPSNKNILV